MAKVTFVLGLAGSGKTPYAEKLKAETGAEYFEGTENSQKNILRKQRMLQHLVSGGDCVVEEIAYCLPSFREGIVAELCSRVPNVEIDWVCFENDIESANWNVVHRTHKGDVPGHLRINQCYQGLYIYPGGAKPIPITRKSEGVLPA